MLKKIFNVKQLFMLILFIVFSTAAVYAQIWKPSNTFDAKSVKKLAGNGVVDIRKYNDYVWFSTSGGLSYTTDEGETILEPAFTGRLPKGGVSALTIGPDGVIWYAAVFDTTINDEDLQAGGGLAYSADNGITWTYIPQPVDPNNPDSLGYSPTTTHVQNTTWEIEIYNDEVWIATWGGGIRKSSDMGKTWTVVTPDNEPFSAIDNLNHLGFSFAVDGENNLWAGTAQGINKSTDGGNTWTHYTAQNGSGISGNFVVAMDAQNLTGGSVVWAATWKAEGETEEYGVSFTDNYGLTWQQTLLEEKINNFAFDGETVYAMGENGIFKSDNSGKNWSRFPKITDQASGDPLYTTEFYSALIYNNTIWAGTADGLIKSDNSGLTWKIFRSFPDPGKDGEPVSYAYPNPFSPARHNLLNGDGHVRIQFLSPSSAEVTLEIFDFSMRRVDTVVKNKSIPAAGSYYEVWNGKNEYNETVANGVYFYKLSISGQSAYWGKIVVID